MNLIIGSTAQQSYFYPDDYIRISSRNIDIGYLESGTFDSVYLPFAEQRIYDGGVDYMSVNADLTIEILEAVLPRCQKAVVFGTCELWSGMSGTVEIDTPFDFAPSGYCDSKYEMISRIKARRKEDSLWNKVVIIHPFYFNSSYRSDYFLFGKIFDSIIENRKIEIGSLDFYRDMVHAKFFVKKVIESDSDMLVGSGRLFNVKDFVYDLYSEFGMDPDRYITYNKSYKANEKFIRPRVEWNYTYSDLLRETVEDIRNRMKKAC